MTNINHFECSQTGSRMNSFVFLSVLLAGCHAQSNVDMCYKTSNPLGTCSCDQQLFVNDDCTQAEQNILSLKYFLTLLKSVVGGYRLGALIK